MWFLKYTPGEKPIKAKHNKTRKNVKSLSSESSPEPEKEPKKKTIFDILLAAKTH
jgi:hypothetical protein